MKKKRLHPFGVYLVSGMILMMALFAGSAFGESDQTLSKNTKPVPRVDENTLQPGLAVAYIYGFWRHMDEMLSDKAANRKAKPGEPIPFINHQFGKTGLIFGSGANRGVGVKMTGFIRLPKPGTYQFMAKSNDGIRVFVHNQRVIDDPAVHGDRLSEAGEVNISDPGWYPLQILYFQRKGSAVLEMHWKRPGDETFSIIPAEAYMHTAPAAEKK